MPKFKQCLVVIDPSHSEHAAMDRVVAIAGQGQDTPIGITLLIGFESYDKSSPDIPWGIRKKFDWVSELQAPLRATGVDFDSEIFWTTDWKRSIIEAARDSGADLILISETSAKLDSDKITKSRWALLREAEVPVEIVRKGKVYKRASILAAVNSQSSDPRYEELNRKVLEKGREISQTYNAEFHVVNAYTASEDMPDRSALQRNVGIPLKNIHRDMGKPEDVIANVAAKVNADLVILGTKARKGLSATLRGNTVEKVLEKLSADVLMLH